MQTFSKIRQFGATIVETNRNFNRFSRVANEVASKAENLEGPASSLMEGAADLVGLLRDTTIPSVNNVVEQASGACSTLQSIFSMLEKLVAPLFKIHTLLKGAWSSITSAFLGFFSKMSEAGDDLLTFLTKDLDLDLTIPTVVIIALVSLLVLKYLLPSSAIGTFIATIVNIMSVIKGYVIGLLPDSLVNRWFSSYHEEISELLVAQGPSAFTSEVGAVGLSEVIVSALSMGFVSVIYAFIGTGKPGKANPNPLSTILCATGDHAQKINQLFLFFKNVKTSLGDTLIWLGEWICDQTGVASPLTATVNMVLNTELFQWFNDVNKACSPANRLENFSNPSFNTELSLLRDRANDFDAQFVRYPVSPFVSGRFTAAVTKLEKLMNDSHAHKGVGQFRPEPFCVQFYGHPGCGKTTIMLPFINDLLNRMGEPRTNRLYSLSSKDGFWSNYNHQVAILIDDFGQVIDAAGQCDDVKQLIFLKSCAPVSLNMAGIEEKGTQFTSRYIFMTSNAASPPRTAGVKEIEAIHRRRNMLIHVTRTGPMNKEACKTPADNMLFSLKNSLVPFNTLEGGGDLTYAEMLDRVEIECKQHWNKDNWLDQFAEGLDNLPEAQVKIGRQIPVTPEEELLVQQELIHSSMQYAYAGSLSLTNPFTFETAAHSHFSLMAQDRKNKFNQWRGELYARGITQSEVSFWTEQITEKVRHNLVAWIDCFDFDENAFQEAICEGRGSMQDYLSSDDPDAVMVMRCANQRSQFAFALLVRQYQAIRESAQRKEQKPTYAQRILAFIKESWGKLPKVVKFVLKFYAIYKCSYLATRMLDKYFLSSFFPIAAPLVANEVLNLGQQTSNISGDSMTIFGGKKNVERFLTAQGGFSEDWGLWASKDPFLQDSLLKNLVILRFRTGEIFRGVYVQPGWILTVGHAFLHFPSGGVFQLVHAQSTIPFALDKRPCAFKTVPKQDLVLFYVGNVDGVKKDITSHFASRGKVMCVQGSKGVHAKPQFDDNKSGHLLKMIVTGVSMTCNGTAPIKYRGEKFFLESAASFSCKFPGQGGDCGSLLLLPSVGNRQPLICGMHCAGFDSDQVKQGFTDTFLSAIFKEDLLEILPRPQLMAQGPSPTLSQLREGMDDPFELKQVALAGEAPASLAISVPHHTTLRKSEIFEVLEDLLGEHLTEPSILTSRDFRLPKDSTFDPYISGVEKFNETACCFDMEVAEGVMAVMQADLLAKLERIATPGGKPQLRSEFEVLNGIPGEEFYDSMEMSTAVGFPFTHSEFGKNKKGYLDGEPGEFVLHRDRPVYPAFCELEDLVRQGIVPEMFTIECAKDERLPLSKVYIKPKTRLFTILPFHYNMLVRRYFLDFSATLMRAHNDISCKVGINPEGLEWTTLAHQFLNVSHEGFSADYSSFDGRAPVFIFQWFCDMIDVYYGDKPDSPNSLARKALMMMASNHHTFCKDKVFRVVGGMPSGFSLTVLFNSLLNEFYMRYAFQKLLHHPRNKTRTIGMSQRDFSNLFVAIYGDDNLVAVPLHMRWYNLPAIAEELLRINVVIKNGLDKDRDVQQTVFLPLGELTFLSRAFVRHVTSYFLSPLKWVSVIEPLRWVRPATEGTAIEALLANIEGSLRQAFMHGKPAFETLRATIQQALKTKHLPAFELPTYIELESKWLTDVTGSCHSLPGQDEKPLRSLPASIEFTNEQFLHQVNMFVEGIFFCSSRTSKHVHKQNYIVVNCVTAHHHEQIRGPTSWKDLSNKIWAYTLSAIEIEQERRATESKPSNLLFVCSTGRDMSVVCAALATLAMAQYTRSQVVERVKLITKRENGIVNHAGGAGFYILLAAQAGNGRSSSDCKGAFSYGSNIYDRCMRVGNCSIITGHNPELIPPSVAWCTPTQGFSGVKTNSLFITTRDPLGHRLSEALTRARRDGNVLFLFFSHFGTLEAEWVLNGLTYSGETISGLVSSDLVLIERQAQMVSNMSLGKIFFSIASRVLGGKMCNIYPPGTEKGDEERSLLVSSSLPIDTTSFSSPDVLREKLAQVPIGQYTSSSVIEVLKIATVLAKNLSLEYLQKKLDLFFPHREMVHRTSVLLTLALWHGMPLSLAGQLIPAGLYADIVRDFKYVCFDPTLPAFSIWHDEFTSSLESLALSLRLHYTHSAKVGRMVFRLPQSADHCTQIILGFYLENVVREKKGEGKLMVPVWFPSCHPTLDALSYLSFEYI